MLPPGVTTALTYSSTPCGVPRVRQLVDELRLVRLTLGRRDGHGVGDRLADGQIGLGAVDGAAGLGDRGVCRDVRHDLGDTGLGDQHRGAIVDRIVAVVGTPSSGSESQTRAAVLMIVCQG